MKKLTLLLALTTCVLGAVCVVQWQKLAGQQSALAALRADTGQKDGRIEYLERAQQRAIQQRRELLQQADELSARLLARQEAETNAAAAAPAVVPAVAVEAPKPDGGKGGLGSFISKMMQDPDTRKFIRDQQRIMLDQLYSPLIKQMGLDPEAAAQFKDLLADNAMKGAEKASSLFGSSDTNRAEAVSTIAAQQKDFEAQLRTFLGDERYAQYQDYQQTVGERTQLNLFRQQMGSDNPLTDQQAEQLLTFMREEKQNALANGQTFPAPGQDAAGLQAALSDEQINKLLQSQEGVNQRVYERARTILSPQQMNAFGEFQNNYLQMMRMGMSMARKFMTPDNPEMAAPSPGQ